MNTLDKTGVPVKYSGDGLSHQDVNAINSTVNAEVDAVNYLLKNFCNVNVECNDYTRAFTLSGAIKLVPETRRQQGCKVRFLNTDGIYTEFIFIGSDVTEENWNNEDNWNTAINIIDGGEW